jgi:hypothetical protein
MDRRTLAHQIGTDVDRVAPLLARILLIRAIWGVRRGGNSRYNHNGLRVAKDVISNCGRAGELAATGATTQELARALAPTHDVDRDLTTAIDAAESLRGALRREETEYADYRKYTDPDGYHDRSLAKEAATAWEKERRDVDAAVGWMPKNLGNGMTGSFLLDRAIDRVFRRGFFYQIRYELFADEPERVWQRRIASVLLDAAHMAVKRGRGIAVESLADHVRTSRQMLAEATPSRWAQQAASRLEEAAVPVFTRQEPLTADKVTAIRLAALCLAHEPEARRITTLGDAFCNIFVGITVFAS